LKPYKSILDPEFIWVPSHKTDIRETFERARKAAPQVSFPPDKKSDARVSEPAVAAPKRCDISCEGFSTQWWDCSNRGCRRIALQRYGEQVVRLEPRPEHDIGPNGVRLKAGK
jgi:hypothetical protein